MNYSRFYALFRLLPKYGDEEMLKAQLVLEASGGRTQSLRELTKPEYDALCNLIDDRVGRRELLRKRRSAVLREMTVLGIDTSDWARVDAFCQQPRIAGKAFRHLDFAELTALLRKLLAMKRKRPQLAGSSPTPSVVMLATPSSNLPNPLPS